MFDVRAMEQVGAISFDGECLRGKCERDPVMGYDFMKRFAQAFMQRLAAARLQLLDLYGNVTR
jgi:CRP/FNR family cyclic AMP-dependent transcriptional regulator